ncbi:hypothetical protein BDW22DRAFT_1449002 [Trametopsis cervina]|nr:hypothetical protein BDW22DRAFT_1449002 [Trametopsis cervina]
MLSNIEHSSIRSFTLSSLCNMPASSARHRTRSRGRSRTRTPDASRRRHRKWSIDHSRSVSSSISPRRRRRVLSPSPRRRRLVSSSPHRRSRSHGRHRSASSSTARAPRATAPSWKYVPAACVVLHNASCTQCSNWLGHRLTSDTGSSWDAARDAEEDDWIRVLADRGFVSPDEMQASIDRARAEWDLAAQPQAHESITAQPMDTLTMPPPCATSVPAPTYGSEVADLQAQVAYLERVAEQLRRALAAKGDTRPNTWSDAAAALTDDELRVKIGSYILSSTVYSREDEYDEEDPTVERRRRYKSAMKRGRTWVRRTESEDSHSASPPPSGKGKGKDVARPLQERISSLGERPYQPGEAHLLDTSTTDVDRDTSPGPSLSSRISHPSPLAERMDVQLPDRSLVVLPRRVLGTNEWMPPSVTDIIQNYFHEYDNDGRPVPLTEKQPGKFRIVYERLIDLGQEFPPSPPVEVLFYPRGFPNWPSTGTSKISEAERIGFPIGTASMAGGKYDGRINGNRPRHEKDVHLVRDMDRSRRLLPWTMIETRDAWNMPQSVSEAEALRFVARMACNLMAWEHWTKVVAWANRIPVEARNDIHHSVLRRPMTRPLWAEWIEPRTKAHRQKVYERIKQKRWAAKRAGYSTGTRSRGWSTSARQSARPPVEEDIHVHTDTGYGEERAEELEDGEWGDMRMDGPFPDLQMFRLGGVPNRFSQTYISRERKDSRANSYRDQAEQGAQMHVHMQVM